MLKRAVQKRRPDDPRQTVQMTGYDAIPGKLAIPKQVIDHKDQPAKGSDHDDGSEPFERGLRFGASNRRFTDGLQFHPRVVLGWAEDFEITKSEAL